MSKIPVYESEAACFRTEFLINPNPIGYVKDTRNLDVWTGRDWQNGGLGHHLGITQLKDKRYVLVFTSQHTGDRDYAYVVSDDVALDAILESDSDDLLNLAKFKLLKKLHMDRGGAE